MSITGPFLSHLEALRVDHGRRVLRRVTGVQLVLSAALALALAHELPPARVFTWMGLLWTAFGVRWLLMKGAASAGAPAVWEKGLLAGTLLIGLGWGASAFFFLGAPHAGPAESALLYVLAGVAAGGGVLHSRTPRVAVVFLVATLAPVALFHLLAWSFGHAFMALATLLYLLTLVVTVRHLDSVSRAALAHAAESTRLSVALEREADRRRQEAERARQRQEERDAEHDSLYRELFANFAESILFLEMSPDGEPVVVSLNPSAERILESRCPAADGREMSQLFAGPFADGLRAQARTALVSGEPLRYEEERVTAAGGRTLEITVIPLHGRFGDICRVAVVARDVTLRRRGEQALRERAEQEARLSGFIASVPGYLYSCHLSADGAPRLRFVSEGIREVCGLAPEQAGAERIDAMIDPEDRDAVVDASVTSARTMGRMRVEYRITHPQKGKRWLERCAQPALDPEGGIVWNGVVQDITERKHQQQRMAMMEYALDHIHDAAYLTDLKGRVLYVNNAACRNLGYAREELQAMSMWQFDLHDDAWMSDPESRGGAAQGMKFETEHRRRDGTTVPVEITISASLPFEGRETRLCLARDMSRQKEDARAIAEREVELRQRAEFQQVLLKGIADAGLHVLVAEGRRLVYATEGPFSNESAAADGQELLELIHPDEREKVLDYYRRRLAGEAAPRQIEVGVVATTGLRREFELAVSVLPGSGQHSLTVAKEITERKRLERQMRRSRDFLQTVIDGVSDPVVVKDADHRWVLINDACCALLGRPREVLQGKSDHDYLPREQADRNWAVDDRVFARDQVQVSEGTVTGADGRKRYFQAKSTPITNGDGERLLVSVLRDITDRRQMEELLAARERELRTLVENMPDAVVRYDLDCRRTFVSPSFEKSAGIAVADVLFTRPRERWGPATMTPEAYEERLREVIATGRPGQVTLEWWAPEGRHNCQLVSIVPEFLPDGAVASVLAVARDVSELKRAEALLHAREEAFRSLAENSPDTIARYDRNLRRVYANPAFVRQSGTTAEALLGATPGEFPGGASAVLYQEKMERVFASGKEAEFEMVWDSADGERRCSYIRIAPERARSGEIISVLAIGRDITDIDGYRRKIFNLAFYDPMTGLANRSLFNDRLQQTVKSSERTNQVLALMLIDLDRFKTINDTLGHAVGDQLLCEAGTRLLRAVRGHDTVARLGGDEFAVLLPQIRSMDDAGHIAGKILGTFARPFVLEGRELFVSASMGVALCPADGTTGDALLKHADSAMYYAKVCGRNNFQFYRAELTARAEERLRLEVHLRKALANGELSLRYQPQRIVEGGTLVAAEALLRWHNPELGEVTPDRFIGIAEDTGIITEIGAWVLQEACRTAAAWNQGGHPVRVAVNLSTRQFRGRGLVNTVLSSLASTGCRPEWLELEITESLLLEENSEAKGIMEELRANGLSFAIDDFGTGYSALAYLRRFPIGTIKIDRSFINGIASDPHAAALVRAMISMAEVLQLTLVAEGVETRRQCDLLREWSAGALRAQGYLFGKPMARREFETAMFADGRAETGDGGNETGCHGSVRE